MSETVEFVDEVCGLYFRSVLLENKGDRIAQHVHDHDHATYIGAGRVRFWINLKFVGDFPAGTALPIRAGVEHEFQALEPNTRLTCVHNAESADSIKARGI